MFLFLVLAVPAWIYAVVSLYSRPSRGWMGLVPPLLGGLVGGALTLVVTLGMLTRNPFGAELAAAYPWAWYRGPGWMLTVLLTALILVYHFRPTSYSRIRELSLWLGGAVLVYTVWYALIQEPGFEAYRMFTAPLVWTVSLGLVIWLADRGLRSDGWISWVFYAAAIITPSLMTFLPVLFVLEPRIISIGISIVVLAGSMVLIYLDSRGRLS